MRQERELTTFRPAPVTRRDNRCRFDQMTELVCGQHLSPDVSPPGTTPKSAGRRRWSGRRQQPDKMVTIVGSNRSDALAVCQLRSTSTRFGNACLFSGSKRTTHVDLPTSVSSPKPKRAGATPGSGAPASTSFPGAAASTAWAGRRCGAGPRASLARRCPNSGTLRSRRFAEGRGPGHRGKGLPAQFA